MSAIPWADKSRQGGDIKSLYKRLPVPGIAWLKLKQWVLRMVRHSMVSTRARKSSEGQPKGGREEKKPGMRKFGGGRLSKYFADFPNILQTFQIFCRLSKVGL